MTPHYDGVVPKTLPRLRMDLDFMPSPVEDRPGLLMRDPMGYSPMTLIVPPPLVPLLEMFDGEQTEDELRSALYEMTGDLRVGEVMEQLRDALVGAGFVEGEQFDEMRAARQREFAESGQRLAAHAGGAYPDEGEEARAWFEAGGVRGEGERGAAAIAAPHVSPEGGWASYREAYKALGKAQGDRVFVVLGTSHYGQPERFGLTRKNFLTPLGEARTETAMVDWLAGKARRAVLMEDYCHAVEHSIEFQVLFLQWLYGADVRVLPVLCGPYGKSLYEGGMPEDDDGVREFIEALGELNSKEGRRLSWVMGVDMAHMGRRYGDQQAAAAGEGWMEEVEQRDRARIERVCAGDADGFWELVRPRHDDLKWCGSAPIYTYLRASGGVRGRLGQYEQWNIDEASVVTFGALAFDRV